MEIILQIGAIVIAGSVVWYFFFYKGSPQPLTAPYNFYELSVEGLDGELIHFNQFRGKKVLLVNTASNCGFTNQYEELEILHQKYKDSLVVLGLPCNQFFAQEPKNEKEIKDFCQDYYKVNFPMSKKIKVKGSQQHPIYQWLTNKELNKVENSIVIRNFQKYLVSESGTLLKKFKPYIKPLDPNLLSYIEKKL